MELSSQECTDKGSELMKEEVIRYKATYNKDRSLPEPKWGSKMAGLQCPTCGSQDMYGSGDPDDPEEVFPYETVRCSHCGHITDWYEAHKQRENHPTELPLEVIRKE